MKKTNRYIVLSALMATAAWGLTSCSEDVAVSSGVNEAGVPIMFTTSVETTADVTRGATDAIPLTGQGRQLWLLPSVRATQPAQAADSRTPWGQFTPQTRGTQVRSVDDMFADDQTFGVSAFRHLESDANLGNAAPGFFYNLPAAKSGDNYVISEDYFWPYSGDDETLKEVLDFQAYYPYNNTNIELSDKEATGDQTIQFTVNSNVRQQCDLMTATARSVSFRTSLTPTVPLKFYHRLCAVRFVVGSQFVSQGYIKTITLNGVYKSGTYTLGSAVGEGWAASAKDNFVLEHNTDKKLTGAAAGDDILDTDETFLMIPQDFTGDTETASVEVLYWDGTQDITLTASLKGQVWEEGSTVTYALSSEKLTTLQVSSVEFPATVSGAPKTAWADGDQVGLYVVDALADGTGTELVYKNIPVTYSSTDGWEVDHTTAQGKLYHKPTYLYYFYYPYKPGTPDGYPEESPKADASGTEFFASIINAWTLNTSTTGNHADQSELDKFLAADLQVARGTMDAPVSTVKASMLRQVGLARFKFATSKTIPETITYTYSGANATAYSTATSGTTTIAPSTNFLNNKPYLSGGIYYFWTKADQTATFNSNPSAANHWLEALNINLAAGAYTADADMVTVQDYRKDWIVTDKIIWQFTKATASTASSIYTWNIPYNAKYKMECWGAAGGRGYYGKSSDYGRGAYTVGKIDLTTTVNSGKLYVYVGGRGTDGTSSDVLTRGKVIAGGWNGGGSGIVDNDPNDVAGGGGGATDIRLTNSTSAWSSRIMIAAGGGGGHVDSWDYTLDTYPTEYTGGLHGGAPNVEGKLRVWGGGMTETSAAWTPVVNQSQGYSIGQGINGSASALGVSDINHGCGGGGGGLYGGVGKALTGSNIWSGRSSGGSSYITGNSNCTAHSSGLTFSSSAFKKGTDNSCPSQTIGGTAAALGQVNGYARITYDQQDQ